MDVILGTNKFIEIIQSLRDLVLLLSRWFRSRVEYFSVTPASKSELNLGK